MIPIASLPAGATVAAVDTDERPEATDSDNTPANEATPGPQLAPGPQSAARPRMAARPQLAPSRSITGSTASSPSAEPVHWFVRPSDGGEYGPADEEALRSWVLDRRVGRDALVWRTGWDEWRRASEVLPMFADIPIPAATRPSDDHIVERSAPHGVIDLEQGDLTAVSQYRPGRKKSIALIAGLGIVSIVLVVALVLIVNMQR